MNKDRKQKTEDRNGRLRRAAVVLGVSVLSLLSSVFSVQAAANDIYITQNGSGGGTSCGDPKSASFFNSSGNWGSGAGQIGAGTTVHLCGTFTFAAGATGLSAQGNGASGNPITIKFESGAILQAPDFGSGGAAIRLDTRSFITVDGGGTGNAAAGTFVPNGVIQATLSGTSGASCIGGPCSHNAGGTGISAGNSQSITIKNLHIQDMYLRTLFSDQSADWAAYFCVSAFPGATNIVIDNNYMHDSGEILAVTGQNMIIRNNDISRTNHGLSTGLAATSYSGAYIYNNHIHDMTNWDAGSPFPYHHDGIHFFQNPGPGYWDNVFIYNNTFDGDIGDGNTGWIFIEATSCTNGHVYIFNNTATMASNRSTPGSIGFYSGANVFFANNTVWGGLYNNSGVACDIGQSGGTKATTINVWKNTICQGQATTFNMQSANTNGIGAIDYNLVGDGSTFGNQQNFGYFGNNTQSITTWRNIAFPGAPTHDAHSILAASLAAIKLNSDGSLQTGSPAIGAGTNLFTTCNGQPIPGLGALCSDKAGNPRPASGAWDIGAYNAPGGSGGGGNGCVPTTNPGACDDGTGAAVCTAQSGTSQVTHLTVTGTGLATNGVCLYQFNPAGTVKGDVVVHAGWDGTIPLTYFHQPLKTAGFRVIDLAWDSDWEDTGAGNAGSVLKAAGRVQAVIDWIYTNVHGSSTAVPYCGIGHSAGSAAFLYAISEYGEGDGKLDHILLSAATPFGRIDKGCDPTVPPMATTICPNVNNISPSFGTSAAKVGSWTHDASCQNNPSGASLTAWSNQSVVSSGEQTTFTKTSISSYYCQNQPNETVPLGTYYFGANDTNITVNVPTPVYNSDGSVRCAAGTTCHPIISCAPTSSNCTVEGVESDPAMLSQMVSDMQLNCIAKHNTSGNPPVITSALVSSGTVGVAYSYQITATNNPTSYNATGLPGGLSVNTTSGLISGTPTTSATSNVTISATNSFGTGSATLVLQINPAPNPVPSLSSLVPSSTTAGGSAFTLTVNGSNFITGSVVRWNGSSRTTSFVSGTKLTASILAADIATAGTASVTVFNPAPGGGTSNALSFTIAGVGGNPPVITSPLVSSGIVGVAYSYQITATNSPTSFNATGLPGGLSVNTTTGRISGTPTTAGVSNVTLSASNAFGTDNDTLVLTITSPVVPPTITQQPVNQSVMVGQTATFTVSASGTAPLSYQWQYASPGTNFFYTEPGATSSTYITPPLAITDDGTQFQCIVTNSAGTVTSNSAIVFVSSSSGSGLPAPVLNLPSYLAVNGTLMANYPSGYSNISYQWTIGPAAGSAYGALSTQSGMISKTSSSANFKTASNTAPLASYALVPGYYTVTVKAVDASGNTSAQAQANVTLVAADLTGVRVYPNPWRRDKHAGKLITFNNLTVDTTVKIFTISGHHVKTLPTSNTLVTWDLTNDSGDKVASGLYTYLITTGNTGYGSSGMKKTGQVAVIK